jgi:hypothetical protein
MADDEISKPPPPDKDYPAIGELPMAPYMPACDTICFLSGYQRAIPVDLYYAPLRRAHGWNSKDPDEVSALLHNAVPDPKPAENPIPAAHQLQMKLWRDKRLHPLNWETKEEVPAELNEYAVIINLHGEIYPDYSATRSNQLLAEGLATNDKMKRSYGGKVCFRTSEVRECSVSDVAAEVTPPGTNASQPEEIPASEATPAVTQAAATGPAHEPAKSKETTAALPKSSYLNELDDTLVREILTEHGIVVGPADTPVRVTEAQEKKFWQWSGENTHRAKGAGTTTKNRLQARLRSALKRCTLVAPDTEQ